MSICDVKEWLMISGGVFAFVGMVYRGWVKLVRREHDKDRNVDIINHYRGRGGKDNGSDT